MSRTGSGTGYHHWGGGSRRLWRWRGARVGRDASRIQLVQGSLFGVVERNEDSEKPNFYNKRIEKRNRKESSGKRRVRVRFFWGEEQRKGEKQRKREEWLENKKMQREREREIEGFVYCIERRVPCSSRAWPGPHTRLANLLCEPNIDLLELRPMSASERIIGSRFLLSARSCFRSCWCRWRRNSASFTLVIISAFNWPLFTIRSRIKSIGWKWVKIGEKFRPHLPAIWSRLPASKSRMTVPLRIQLRSSNSEWSEMVLTWGFDHRLPPSSTSSSNLIQLWWRTSEISNLTPSLPYRAVSLHSSSSLWRTNSAISLKSGCDSCPPSVSSSPRMKCTRSAIRERNF